MRSLIKVKVSAFGSSRGGIASGHSGHGCPSFVAIDFSSSNEKVSFVSKSFADRSSKARFAVYGSSV
jgi:hypothetical protein